MKAIGHEIETSTRPQILLVIQEFFKCILIKSLLQLQIRPRDLSD